MPFVGLEKELSNPKIVGGKEKLMNPIKMMI
jgi:hypothetical protein